VETIESTYGSDKDGLVWGYRFVPGEPASPVGCDGAASLLRAGRDGDADSFVWLHFSLANAASERWLRQHLSLPAEFHASLHEAIGSTRVEQDGDSLIAVIHDVMFDFTVDTADVSTVALCVTHGYAVAEQRIIRHTASGVHRMVPG
jgi:zinc transporter